MATLNPLEEFVIARQLNDPADVTTYYVQAEIRNAKTDAIIQTVNLNDKGGQRFTKTWQVVQDPTGLGLYITITTTVYTDSGYTIKSSVYGVEQIEHLVQDRLNPFQIGGGVDVDYKKIRELVKQEIAKINIPEPKEPDLIPISEGLQAVISEIRAIHIPKPEKTDLQPVLKQVESVLRAIKDKPDFEPTDLTPIASMIEKNQPSLKENTQKLEQMLERVREFFIQDIEGINQSINELKEQFAQIDYILPIPKEREAPKPDIYKEYLNGD
jgi:hypothetical protein